MAFELRTDRPCVPALLLCLLLASAAQAAPGGPTTEQALKEQAVSFSPVQKDVEYDRPSAAEAPKCTLKTENSNDGVGLVLRGPNGQVLRMFLDTNGDKAVDRWSYFKDGVEVYRDVDSNFDKKADQYRWLNSAGTRWGLDEDQDGRIDVWRMISPEEISAEVVAAIRERDSARFARLLLTPKELKSLGMATSKEQELAQRLASAQKTFRDNLPRAKDITTDTHWVYFGGSRPGLVPAGTNDLKQDLEVYENVVAIVETAGKDGQVPVGTIVRVGNMWRLIDVPDALLAADDRQGTFIQPAQPRNERSEGGPGQPTAAAQKLITELEVIDKQIAAGAAEDQLSKLNDRRSSVLQQLAAETDSPGDRAQWLRQLADTVVTAVQEGGYEGGVDRLRQVYEELSKKPDDAELAAYFHYRLMQADFNTKQQEKDADYPKLQKEWIENLEKFVSEHEKSPDAADAMLHLAIANENAGEEQKALKWYGEIVKNFPTATAHDKAMGAQRRLQSVGKVISLRAKPIRGKEIDLAQYKNKVVLIQYWATWCEPCRADMAQLKELLSKYGKSGFEVIGINLDSNSQDLSDYLKENELPWPQVYEKGGLDSRLANELGIVVVPTAILIDRDGKVANRDAHVSQLENDLRVLLGQSPQGAKAPGDKKIR